LILSDLLSDLLSLLQRFMNISQSVHILQSKPSGTMLRVDQLVKLDPDTSLATWEKKNKKQNKQTNEHTHTHIQKKNRENKVGMIT